MTTYRRAENAPPTDRPTLHITSASLAVLWWRDVRITFTEPIELNELDEFAVAAVTRLGSLSAQDFEEFTGLPPLIFNGLARRLHSLGLLDWRDGTLRPTAAEDPSEMPRKAAKTTTASVDLVYLPGTDELLVAHEGLAVWERAGLQPIGASPLPETLHRTTFRNFISARVRQGRVAGLPANAIELTEGDDEPLTAMVGAHPEPPVPVCPVFLCAATLVLGEGRSQALLDASENPRKKSKKANRVTIDVSDAKGLIGRWAGAVTELTGKPSLVEEAMRSLGLAEPPWPSLVQDHSGAWRLSIDGRHAQTLSREGLLTLPIGLEICEPDFNVTMALVLEPVDDEARQLIRLDRVLQETLQRYGAGDSAIGKHHAGIREVGGIARLMSRAWQLRFYSLVYQAKESEHFDYA
ncbi:hypothetical protein Rhe02_63420 [Rhizocola hellebori]|uniref:Uncharacterized protein n=1 Tax=Rhizocola hellebori TaxID=1392758 RepID=A0A8J3VJ54_9ACTN|nr:hypothetical protein [Rhizocola hellebori]GIH08275.1 hypothetical protein Rhe02_63420 [Rhizocola hellebori]